MNYPQNYIKLSAALDEVAAHTSETDVARRLPALREKYTHMGFFLPEASASSQHRFASFNRKLSDHWLKQEAGVLRLDCAILEGKIKTYARDPKTGAQYHVDRRDWKAAAFREESLRGGTIRACAGERIEQYRDWDAVIDEALLERWLTAGKSRRPIADQRKFGALLLEAMRASSDQKNRTKREWRMEASGRFGVSVRAFNRIWKSAIEASGSTWDRPGRPPNHRP